MSRRKENICGNEKSRAALSQTDESAAGLVQERSMAHLKKSAT
jgi:hypothetical protein